MIRLVSSSRTPILVPIGSARAIESIVPDANIDSAMARNAASSSSVRGPEVTSRWLPSSRTGQVHTSAATRSG